MEQELEKATFGAGCFWGVEEAFRRVEGVVNTTVGYAGGKFPDPTYEDVCSGKTGHAEVIEIEFDPKRLTYDEVVSVFWRIHDPTQLNRQGPDTGEQYRSVIFYHDKEQERIAKESIEREQEHHSSAIVTQVVPASIFYKAEEYHQRYCDKH